MGKQRSEATIRIDLTPEQQKRFTLATGLLVNYLVLDLEKREAQIELPFMGETGASVPVGIVT